MPLPRLYVASVCCPLAAAGTAPVAAIVASWSTRWTTSVSLLRAQAWKLRRPEYVYSPHEAERSRSEEEERRANHTQTDEQR